MTGTGDGVVAKLAGTYEMETYRAFERAMRNRPALFVDIGAAEGFYVSAFARAVPGVRVIAYEAKEEWRHRIRRSAERNGVASRCDLRGFCDPAEFRRLLGEAGKEPIFILMDIEGGEFDLLNEETLPLLGHAELLVELHESESREPGDALAEMFRRTHAVELIWAKGSRSLEDVCSPWWKLACSLLPPVRRRLDEGRAYKMRWMHAVPRPAAGAAGV
ncbi:MAG: hypothetical protein IAE97_05280 [Chthoniobacterales bacterium]|nr:hypothetical protein [Chthoniobacterales bacterium]